MLTKIIKPVVEAIKNEAGRITGIRASIHSGEEVFSRDIVINPNTSSEEINLQVQETLIGIMESNLFEVLTLGHYSFFRNKEILVEYIENEGVVFEYKSDVDYMRLSQDTLKGSREFQTAFSRLIIDRRMLNASIAQVGNYINIINFAAIDSILFGEGSFTLKKLLVDLRITINKHMDFSKSYASSDINAYVEFNYLNNIIEINGREISLDLDKCWSDTLIDLIHCKK